MFKGFEYENRTLKESYAVKQTQIYLSSSAYTNVSLPVLHSIKMFESKFYIFIPLSCLPLLRNIQKEVYKNTHKFFFSTFPLRTPQKEGELFKKFKCERRQNSLAATAP